MLEKNNRNIELEKLFCLVSDKIYKHGSKQLRGQGKILSLLYKSGTASQKEIQQNLDIRSGSISEMVSKLINKKYVIKTLDPQDRRKIMLTITELGKNCVNKYMMEYKERENIPEIFDLLTDEEKVKLLNILHKLV